MKTKAIQVISDRARVLSIGMNEWKSSSGSGGVWLLIYSFLTSSVTFPLVATQYPLAHERWPQYRFLNLLYSVSSLYELFPLKYCAAFDTDNLGEFLSAYAHDLDWTILHRRSSPCCALSLATTHDIGAPHPHPEPGIDILSSTQGGTYNPKPCGCPFCNSPSP